jgi:hypothetical protein
MTNARGEQIAEWRMALFDDASPLKGKTLGAYRASKHMPWVPGAQIAVWVPCARGPVALGTGVEWPHCYFIQTQGGNDEGDHSMFCPACRTDRAATPWIGAHATKDRPVSKPVSDPAPDTSAAQTGLPF